MIWTITDLYQSYRSRRKFWRKLSSSSYIATHPKTPSSRHINQVCYANHSTQLAITFLTDKIRGHMEKGLLREAVFIDLKKAFDTVPHDGLLNKLFRYGIQDQPLSWFESYLTNRTQSVSIENHLSSAANISSGVPQGSVLGPLLFILYINDLPLAVGLSSVMLYADDTVIFSAASSIDQLQLNLSLDLNVVSNWLTANGLFLNLKKTE